MQATQKVINQVMQSMYIVRRDLIKTISLSILGLGTLVLFTGCQSANPAGPTPIPSPSITATLPEPDQTGTPETLLHPVVTATFLAPTAGPVVQLPSVTPTPGPFCSAAKKGDTVLSLVSKAGYASLDVLPAFRELNKMCPTCNDIQEGKTYCVPQKTPTPTAQGYDLTQTARAKELPTLMAQPQIAAIATYIVVQDDNIISIQLKTNASLHEICALNDPSPINCGGCQVDKPINQQGCHPTVHIGDVIRIPGPTPTPTITPTLTGSETMTSTPVYAGPKLVSPANADTTAGAVQLVWLPSGILQPDELYLVVITDSTLGKTWEYEATATSYRLPASMIPSDGRPHTMNWQVAAASKAADGSYIKVGKDSLIYTFSWQSG